MKTLLLLIVVASQPPDSEPRPFGAAPAPFYRRLVSCLGVCLFLAFGSAALSAQEPPSISLPPPQTEGGKPLMEALKMRRTTREFKPGSLSAQELSNLLWAGFGINRPETGQRTAPSAMNSQEVDLYVALAEGLYLYEAKAHRLKPVMSGDLRAGTNGQPFARDAAAVLIYVAELPRLTKAKADTRLFYAGIDTGCITQNVYLFCASAGLATVVYDLDRPPLAAAMKLRPEQSIILAQAVGRPKAAVSPEK
jgi:SagB-type dehydrogenase family enzyme